MLRCERDESTRCDRDTVGCIVCSRRAVIGAPSVGDLSSDPFISRSVKGDPRIGDPGFPILLSTGTVRHNL